MADARQLRQYAERLRRENEQLKAQLENVDTGFGDGGTDDDLDNWLDDGPPASTVPSETQSLYDIIREEGTPPAAKALAEKIEQAKSIEEINAAIRNAS
jgi:hypothetical protein